MQSSHFQRVLVVLVYSTRLLYRVFVFFWFIFEAQSSATHTQHARTHTPLWSFPWGNHLRSGLSSLAFKKTKVWRVRRCKRRVEMREQRLGGSLHLWADRVLCLESLSDPKLSLLDLAATGPKVLFGLCSSEAPPRESAEGRGGPGGRSGPASVSRFPGVGKESPVGPWDGAASVDREASAAAPRVALAVVNGAAAVGRGRLLTALVVWDGLGVMAARGEISGPVEVFWMSVAWVVTLSFLLQDSQHSLLYPGMEQ